ncbi:MAG: carboxypeptidase regulatory-like domain-containing protein [Acidobacteria bacterium]|nr:carboxypeptidase regulatory-like domain-containing protein [Acidobacteriota bacterium]
MIQKPCNNDWKQMSGDDRRRHCVDCGKDVHAVSAYSDSEWAAMAAGGNICAYWEGETPSTLRSRRAIVAGALLTAIAPLFADNGTLLVTTTDVTGGQIAGATVTLSRADGKESTGVTNRAGVAEFAGLPLGDYAVRVSMAGSGEVPTQLLARRGI